MKKYGGKLKTAGGVILFLAAMASDGGMALWSTVLLAALAVALMAAGEILSRPRKKRLPLEAAPRRRTVPVRTAA